MMKLKHANNTAAQFLLSTRRNTGQGGAGLLVLVRRGPIMILIFEIVWN